MRNILVHSRRQAMGEGFITQFLVSF